MNNKCPLISAFLETQHKAAKDKEMNMLELMARLLKGSPTKSRFLCARIYFSPYLLARVDTLICASGTSQGARGDVVFLAKHQMHSR